MKITITKNSPNVFYVYRHIRTDTGVVFYVGKGSGIRAFCTRNRGVFYDEVKSKVAASGHEIVAEIVKSGLSEACALTLERAIIHSIGKCNLVNDTDGGMGTRGRYVNDYTKDKIKSSLKDSWRKKIGKLKSDITEEKREERVIRKQNRESEIIRKRDNKKFTCANDGKVFYKAIEAAKFYGISNTSVSSVLKGKQKSTNGYIFYRGDAPPEINGIPDEKPVVCIKTGVKYPSVGAASRATGCSRRDIRRVLNSTRKTIKGHVFRWA